MTHSLGSVFTSFTDGKLRQYGSEIERCLARLDDRQVWHREGQHENTVGNLVLHLCGNLHQRIGAIQGLPDTRTRAAEFAATEGLTSVELARHMHAAVDAASELLPTLTDERLHERVIVGEFDQTVLEAIYHMSIHFALHTGQIIFITKRITGKDLGFYKPPASQPQTPIS
jgi:Protein of unknown function (DUF1572)